MEPIFIAAPSRRLFAVFHPPATSAQDNPVLIYLPPFAEEMNRSRRMAALQARSLNAAGLGVLLLDPTGTGDSDGDFNDARWELWREDVAAAASWLNERGHGRLGLWGLRLGALLAADVARERPDRFRHLVLWHPVTDGGTMLTQFLRIRVATAMAQGVRESVETLRAELAAGREVEIAGYELSPALAQILTGLRMTDIVLPDETRIAWLELGDSAGNAVSPATQRVLDAWTKQGVAISTTVVAGDPFWTLQETTLAPELLAATVQAVRAWWPRGVAG